MEEYCLNEFFREVNTKKVRIYLATETTEDPFEQNTNIFYLNPISVDAIVSDLTFAKAQWAMPGIIADKTKEIIIKKKYRSLLEKSHKVQIAGETDIYEGWKVNGKMQIREEGDFLRVYIYIKKVN